MIQRIEAESFASIAATIDVFLLGFPQKEK